jgi:APA family basic amino acid/polyamine antiporter
MIWKSLFRTKPISQILTEASTAEGLTHGPSGLNRTLGVWDLTALGIAAIIGAGVFSTIGTAASTGGAATIFLFMFTAIACAFSALCYAEFASSIPVAGSAYTYAYASLGELLAWIIGWDLLMEYAIGNIAVAISWGDYFNALIAGYGLHLPKFLTTDLLTASRAYDQVKPLLDSGVAVAGLAAKGIADSTVDAYQAYVTAPQIFGFHCIIHLPAVVVTILVTWVVYIGIQESKRVSNVMVILKLLILFVVIVCGANYIKPSNWHPFAPNGISGVMKGVSAIFFAYIGFDAISTTAEECKNPQRDLPRAMIYSLIICTVLYIAVALVLTGVVRFDKLAVGDPLAYAFGPEGASVNWIAGFVAWGAIIALFTVLLVFQLGQPRIWMAMSRDGLLPPIFAKIHPKYRTPSFSTVLTGFVVAVPCMFMNLTEVTDLTSIGTLFAFVLVCAGVLRFDPHRPKIKGQFYAPYLNGKWIFPILVLAAAVAAWIWNHDGVMNLINNVNPDAPDLHGWDVLKHRIPLIGFDLIMIYLAILSFMKNLSLIPLLGLGTCGYLMTELGIINWARFGIWLIVGLAIYFLYSVHHSKLRIEHGER